MAGRLLIAAGAVAAEPGQLPPGVRALIDAADQVMVIAPRLPKLLEWVSSDTDKATAEADERLQALLGHMDELDKPASGELGADDPLVAFEDAIRKFVPDHILVALRSEDRAGWQERGLLDRVEKRFGLPLTVFELQE
jgi:acyl-CoA reductase-like NAD-dependent aldehyde dehydrogenase